MAELTLQTADWKAEKHVPVIEAPDTAGKDEIVKVTVEVGKEIAHPNTAEHHIKSIEVYYLIPEEKFPLQVARFEFNTHGESVQGPDTSTVYSQPKATAYFKAGKSGTILVTAYCNIHGVWKNTRDLRIE
ncbi:MAG: class II SORL domain-containing protein [Candidatus Omnitrophota bacterium]|jgi:superoxide reductase